MPTAEKCKNCSMKKKTAVFLGRRFNDSKLLYRPNDYCRSCVGTHSYNHEN